MFMVRRGEEKIVLQKLHLRLVDLVHFRLLVLLYSIYSKCLVVELVDLIKLLYFTIYRSSLFLVSTTLFYL